MDAESAIMSQGFTAFIEKKMERNGEAGRPHFLHILAQDHDPIEEVLHILELAWIKEKSNGVIARRYNTSYHTIYRLLQDIEPFKDELIQYLLTTPRRKQFFNKRLGTSDYETVNLYIKRAHRDGLKRWKVMIDYAEKCWKALNYKDPANWTADEVVDYVNSKTGGQQFVLLIAIRQVAPQIGNKRSPEYVSTIRFKAKIKRRKKDIFSQEYGYIRTALKEKGLDYELIIMDLHVATGAREGTKNPKSGLCGFRWNNFKRGFQFVDLFESKIRGGITWKDCPVGLLFSDLPDRLKKRWTARGKPTNAKVVTGGYAGLTEIYKRICKAVKEFWQGKIDPYVLKEISQLRPHDANKIHVNLLWEAEVPFEVVCGQYLGGGEGIGLVGRGWLDANTVKEYYLSLTRHSQRFKDIERQIARYARRFNGGV